MRFLLIILFFLTDNFCFAQDDVYKIVPLDGAYVRDAHFRDIVKFTNKKIFIIEQDCFNDTCNGSSDSSYYCFTGWRGVQYGKDLFISSPFDNLSYAWDEEEHKQRLHFWVHSPQIAVYDLKSKDPLKYQIAYDHGEGRTYSMELTILDDKHVVISGQSPYRENQQQTTTYKLVTPPQEVIEQMSELFQ